jgi:LysM repeat protein
LNKPTNRYNLEMRKHSLKLSLALIFLLGVFYLASCGSQPIQIETPKFETPLLYWPGTLEPYITSSPSANPLPATLPAEIPFTPTPSPTPFTHTVAKGETLLGIAIRYGISLDELRAANPEVEPRLMSVGQVLIIPLLEASQQETFITPTPAALLLGLPKCYPASGGNISCLVEMENVDDETVESVQIWFGLFDAAGNLVQSRLTIPPLNLLPSKGRTAAVANFSSPIPDAYQVKARVVAALAAVTALDRYVPIKIQDLEIEIAIDSMLAHVSGVLTVDEPVQWVWAAAFAFDADGRVVGMRKWKGQPDCRLESGNLEAGTTTPDLTSTPVSQNCGPFPFEMTVFSLGPRITRVEVQSEAGR